METAPLIAGVDEVGRGALFGPVVAAVVVVRRSDFPRLIELGVRDSKRLTPRRREKLSDRIREIAVEVRVGYATVAEIDRLNIFHASLLAMRRAVTKLSCTPSLCLIDGMHTLVDLSIVQEAMVKGDERSPAIAAASIVAKVWRDDLITRWAKRYPDHALDLHKGYGTARHLQAIREFGITSQHRRSFSPCRVIDGDVR
ncbi:ribonuclease HII [Pannus brasiliensis]|uniref:ribonuclease HII n=1 Tax=Pannus brasiliensis TaxID=1579216 RepID=UPI003BEF1B3E